MFIFKPQDRVVFSANGINFRGRITNILSRKSIRVVSDSGKRFVVSSSKVKKINNVILMLETRMNRRGMKTDRAYGPMLITWLSAYDNVSVMYERIHTIEDIERFIQRHGTKAETRIIHIMGHGTYKPKKNRTTFKLTFNSLDLIKDIDVFRGLDGKTIIFSCCSIGENKKAMKILKDESGAAAIITYRKEVYEAYTNLCEAMIYDRLIDSNDTPNQAVEKANRAMKALKMSPGTSGLKNPVLVCF